MKGKEYRDDEEKERKRQEKRERKEAKRRERAESGENSPGSAKGGDGDNTLIKKPIKMGDAMDVGEIKGGFDDDFLGIKAEDQRGKYNEVMDIKEAVAKRKKENTKEKAALINRMKEWQKAKLKPPMPEKLHRGFDQIEKVTDLIIEKFSVTIGGKELIQDTTLKVVMGRKYGLHGRNGTGKTCLLATLARKDHPKIKEHMHIVTVEQDLDYMANDVTPLEWVLRVDTERETLKETIASLERQAAAEGGESQNPDAAMELNKAQDRWQEIEADTAPHLAAQMLSGLGFDEDRQRMATVRLSGGWRARVALAR